MPTTPRHQFGRRRVDRIFWERLWKELQRHKYYLWTPTTRVNELSLRIDTIPSKF
jgi:hypothetical protein